jgi:hypothetical protein
MWKSTFVPTLRSVGVVYAAMLASVSGVTMPAAAGDPGQFPDLNSYTEVNSKDYDTYAAYATSGVQFTTPGGYRCRMTSNVRGGWMAGRCWGSLPGISQNSVSVGDRAPATFENVDLGAMENYQVLDGAGWHEKTVVPDAYKLLPTGSKVTKQGVVERLSATCAVDLAMTACVIEDFPERRHGFVLSPQSSWAF